MSHSTQDVALNTMKIAQVCMWYKEILKKIYESFAMWIVKKIINSNIVITNYAM